MSDNSALPEYAKDHPLYNFCEALREFELAGHRLGSARGDVIDTEMINLGVVWTLAKVSAVATRAQLGSDPACAEMVSVLEIAETGLRSEELRNVYGRWLEDSAARFMAGWRRARAAAGDVRAIAQELGDIRRLLEQPVVAKRDANGNIVAGARAALPTHVMAPYNPDFRSLRSFMDQRKQAIQILSGQRYAIPYEGDGEEVMALVHNVKTGELELIRPARIA